MIGVEPVSLATFWRGRPTATPSQNIAACLTSPRNWARRASANSALAPGSTKESRQRENKGPLF